jgi:hypothetical protein
LVLFVGQYEQHDKRVGIGLSKPPHPLEVGGTGQAEPALHRSLSTAIGSTIPVNFLNVVIFCNRQAIATFGAPGFQDFAPISRRHARPKTVHAQPAADFGLVSTFGHSYVPISAYQCFLTKRDYTLRDKKMGVIRRLMSK